MKLYTCAKPDMILSRMRLDVDVFEKLVGRAITAVEINNWKTVLYKASIILL